MAYVLLTMIQLYFTYLTYLSDCPRSSLYYCSLKDLFLDSSFYYFRPSPSTVLTDPMPFIFCMHFVPHSTALSFYCMFIITQSLQISYKSPQPQPKHHSMNNEINESRASSRYSSRHPKNKHSQSFRPDIHQIQHQIRSLQGEIQFTICNYQSILQTQKKNTAERNEFLLYLIQSMKQKHNDELAKYQSELQSVLQQKQQATSLQSQMKNIGEGVDSILQEGKKLKEINHSLVKQLEQQNLREKQLDEEIESHTKQIEELRTQVDEWEVKKIKWNRKKKDMVQMIEETQNIVKKNLKICSETGIEEENCEHCENLSMKKLINKYQANSK